ncbi:MAG: hypothetical protein O2815_11760 [Actinomycetota bacterium]|nr:hypothetical protein [Actinomycetota bacterium]
MLHELALPTWRPAGMERATSGLGTRRIGAVTANQIRANARAKPTRFQDEVAITWAEAPTDAGEQLMRQISEFSPGLRVAALAETMASIKGLERPVVLWRSADEAHRLPSLSTPELLYTAFTRTTCLLIINLEPGTSDLVQRLVTALSPEHLLFWDNRAMNTFDDWKRELQAT